MKQQIENINILIVDDSPETIELIKRNLESVGYHIYSSSNVQSAVKLLDSVHIDLVITDLRMPGENGMALVRHVAENFKDIGTLVITGFPSDRKSTRLNSSHLVISYAVFCLKKKKTTQKAHSTYDVLYVEDTL